MVMRISRNFASALILTAMMIVIFVSPSMANPIGATSPDALSSSQIQHNTAYANASINYYTIGDKIEGLTQFNPTENLTPSKMDVNYNGVTFTFNKTSPLTLPTFLGDYRYFRGTEVGYDPSASLNFYIEYGQYGYGFVWFNLSVYYANNNTFVGEFPYYRSPENITYNNFITAVLPVWNLPIDNGFYSIELGMSTGPYNGKVWNITTPNSNELGIIGYGNYSTGNGSLTLNYPSDTRAFVFQYTSPYNVSLDGRTPSLTFTKTYSGILPTYGDFTDVQANPNTPYFDISWSLSEVVLKENTTENLTYNANVYHLLYNFDANYTFTLASGGGWLNGATADNASWATTFFVSISHLINAGIRENASFNAFCLDGNLIPSNTLYINYTEIIVHNSGKSGDSDTFEVITEDQTNLYGQPPGENAVNGLSISSYVYSAGIGAGVAGIGLSVAFLRRKKG